MGYLNSNLAREVARLTGWTYKIWSRRYDAILISNEEEAQVARMIYVLSHGVKEFLFPAWSSGAACFSALLTGQSLEGTWFDRTREYSARMRGEDFGARSFAETEIVTLEPLPCCAHLPSEIYQERIAGLVEKIERCSDRASPDRNSASRTRMLGGVGGGEKIPRLPDWTVTTGYPPSRTCIICSAAF